jgi:very-short-patch-repair endonuclease
MSTYNPKTTKNIRRKLRNNPPLPETLLWQKLKQSQLGIKFRRQHGMLGHIVDFYAPSIKLVIEIDGDTHFKDDNKLDKKRQKEIENVGNQFLRFTNQDVMRNLDGVLSIISKCVHQQPPPPLLTKDGSKSSPLLRGSQRGLGHSQTYTIKTNQSRHLTLKGSGDYTVTLAGEGAEVIINSATWLKNQELLNLNLTIIHAAPNTQAHTSLKAVVDDTARAVINGTIIVQKDAQKTNSFLEERVLLLSDKARADAIPNLEIEANDVKCSHAAAVGRIDEEQLFYLKSRGIPEPQAKTLIAKGFLNHIK